MRKTLLYLFACLTISACNNPQNTTSKFSKPGPGKYIEWFGNNDMANEFAMIGMRHFMNAEQEKAYTFSKQLFHMTLICSLLTFVLPKCH